MPFVDKLREAVIGKPHNPLHPDTRHNIALVAFLAWIGLGADGLSSACYGPEESLWRWASIPISVFPFGCRHLPDRVHYRPRLQSGNRIIPVRRRWLQGATQLLGPRAGLISIGAAG